MTAALQDVNVQGTTRHPMLAAIAQAEFINRRNGGPLVAPWELDSLPDEWLDAYQVLSLQESGPKRPGRFEGAFQAFRQKHPTYRKH